MGEREGDITTESLGASSCSAHGASPVPGLIAIFSNQQPMSRIWRVADAPLELGRANLAEGAATDGQISRQHARIVFDGTAFLVTDLGSRNGTFLRGARISGETRAPVGSTIRIGGTVLLTTADIQPFKDHGLGVRGGSVGGPALRRALATVALTQRAGLVSSLLISGESGTGKEIAAQVFHASGPRPNAAFCALNCATIPKDLAERLLFGSRRGAYSGATDAPGHVQAADGGTLFLDEIAELPADVQSKLLRMLETREVLRLGATSHERVDVRVCAATWRDLRTEVALGRFREDLYYRIGQPEIRLPPLRERIEEIPWHIQQVLDACAAEPKLTATATFIEECALRAWPGNVRELRAEVRRAAAGAAARGSGALDAEDLGRNAGKPIARSDAAPSSARFPEDAFAAALAAVHGNVVAAARRLGVHRNKVRRWLERHQVDARCFKRHRGKAAPARS